MVEERKNILPQNEGALMSELQASSVILEGLKGKVGMVAAFLVFSLSALVSWGGGERNGAEGSAKAVSLSLQGKQAGEVKEFTIAPRMTVKFRWCPATGPQGFVMGSPATEKDRELDEVQHKVVLSKGFWMGETEVTQGLWKAVMGSNPSSVKKGDAYPVEKVSWDDCQRFIKKVNQSGTLPAGVKLAMPTEAQWEYACRAGSAGAYAGSGKLDDMGWYEGNSKGSIQPVGKKKANAWGLKDMHGNVWEWCSDKYAPYRAVSETDPTGSSDGKSRVARGGSWYDSLELCRSAARDGYAPSSGGIILGLRLIILPVAQ